MMGIEWFHWLWLIPLLIGGVFIWYLTIKAWVGVWRDKQNKKKKVDG